MSYTNKTEFYEIPLPEETDLYDPMDYNASMEAVDTALHGAVQNASSAVSTANSASDAAAAATSGLEALSETVNTEKGKLTALTARVTAAENEIDDVRGDSEDMICAYNEPTATSTHAYSAGDFFIYNDVLYKATDTIAIGDTIIPNTNCAATNITTEIDAINTALTDLQTKVKTVEITGTTDANGRITGASGSGSGKIALSAWRVNSSNIVDIYRYVDVNNTINTINYKVTDSETGNVVANTAMTIKLAYLDTALI